MRLTFLRLFLAVIFTAASGSFGAEPGFETEQLVLYQPDEVLRERLPSAEVLAEYFKKLEALCVTHFAAGKTPANLDLVVVIKPGESARVWFISSRDSLPSDVNAISQELEAVKAPAVTGGPVAFAVLGRIAGGVERSKEAAGPPVPQAWKDAAIKADDKGPYLLPEGYLKHVWPEALVGMTAKPEIEYVTQVMEPTGGRIQKPKNWHYREAHRESTYMWTLSEEDSDSGSYVTGVRIQAFAGVKEATGQTPKEFLLAFLESKKAAADKIVETCEEKDAGLFTRICLEVEEGNDHILYSLFWGNNGLDMAVVSISGTTRELWKQKWPIFQKMREFELIDMKRFEKK